MPSPRPEVARKLASIMTAQRRGKARPLYGQRSGRIDARSLHRIATSDDPRCFTTRGAQSPTRLRLVIVLDMSGSMLGSNMERAMRVVRDLTDAVANVRTVKAEAWGFTVSTAPSGDRVAPEATRCREGDYIEVIQLWQQGMTFESLHKRVNTHPLQGNEDGFSLQVIGDEVMRTLSRDERALFIMVSDGVPVYNEDSKSMAHVARVVDGLRRRGAGVVSVSVSSSLRKAAQHQMYGEKATIPYDANPNVLVQSVAKAVGQALA
jgi:cobalamin biosynthesis protein CobT